MIDKFTVERSLLSEKIKELIDYNKETGIIRYKDDGFEINIDSFIQSLRKKYHCDFEGIFYCHGTLESVLKCRECGTVIFASDDYNEFEENLCCPTCSDYKTHFGYWTKEEIEHNKEKQNTLKMMKAQMDDEAYHQKYFREHKRYPWEKLCFDFTWRNHEYDIKVICNKDRFHFMDLAIKEIDEEAGIKYVKPKFERYIQIRIWEKEDENEWLRSSKRHDIYIPLNIYSVKFAFDMMKARIECNRKNKTHN